MFVDCPGGGAHWGPSGAAGLALWADGALLLQARSPHSHQGGTWSIPGGAIEPGESPRSAALRETSEEISVDLSGLVVLGEVVDVCPQHGCVWTYTTLVAAVPSRPLVAPRSWESDALRWTARQTLESASDGDLPLHPGLRRALPRILLTSG